MYTCPQVLNFCNRRIALSNRCVTLLLDNSELRVEAIDHVHGLGVPGFIGHVAEGWLNVVLLWQRDRECQPSSAPLHSERALWLCAASLPAAYERLDRLRIRRHGQHQVVHRTRAQIAAAAVAAAAHVGQLRRS